MNTQTATPTPLKEPDVVPGTSLEGYNEGEAPPSTLTQVVTNYKPPKTLPQRLAIPLTILVVLFIVGSIAFILFNSTRQMTPGEERKFNQQTVDLSKINDTTISNNTSGQLAVNGGLSVAGSFQVTPNEKPQNPNTGQIFYDKERNALGYYNGSEFVYMQGNSTSPPQTIDNSTSVTTNTTSNTTIINNATQLAPPSVLLQQGTPSTAQLGNFNVDGTGNISNLTSDNATVNNGDITNLSSDTATITDGNVDSLNSNTANINNGNVSNLTSDDASINNGTVSNLNSDNANITNGTVNNLTSDSANINNGDITNLSSDTAAITAGNINTLNSDTATIETGTITTANVDVGNINTANVETGNITTANVETGNIDTANIGIVNTTQVDSGGDTFTVNKFAELPSGLPVTAGETSLGAGTLDTGFSKYATKVTTGSTGGPLQSVSVYIKTAPSWGALNAGFVMVYTPNPLVVSVYADDGNFPSKPSNILWTTTVDPANITNDSWLTVNTDNIPLQSGTSYWVSVRSPGDPYFLYYDNHFVTSLSNKLKDNSTCYNSSAGTSNPFGACTLSNSIMNVALNYTSDPSTGGAGAMFSLTNTGQTAFRNTADSPNAFRIQNTAGSTIFNVDTYYSRIAIGKSSADYTLDVGGDLNLTSNSPIRFGGSAAVVGSTTTTTIKGSTTVAIQGGTFAVQNVAGTTNYLTVNTSTGATTLAGATTFSSTTAHTGAATFASTATVTGATTLNGATAVNNTLTNKVTSTTAFQIQNASNVGLFVADTTNMVITVKGTDTTFGNLTLTDAHFKSTQTTAPTIATPTNCGTTPTAAVTTGSTDSAGSFTITTGTGGTSSTCDTTITFRKAYGAAPKSIIVVGKGSAAAAQRQIYVVSGATTTFTVSFANSTAGADSTPYTFNYWVIE